MVEWRRYRFLAAILTLAGVLAISSQAQSPPPVDTAATIQARIDAATKDGVVEVSGPITLTRPLILTKDRFTLQGSPKATLKTTGAFPAIIVAPPVRRFPGFPGRHRVDITAQTDGTLTQGLDLGGAPNDAGVLRMPGSAWEGLGVGNQFTLSVLAIRKGASWGNNGTAPVLATERDLGKPDPFRLLVKSNEVISSIRTSDGVIRTATFARAVDNPTARVSVVWDLTNGLVGAYIDGVYVAPGLTAIGANWGPGKALAYGEFPDSAIGLDPATGQGEFVLGGFRISNRLQSPVGVAPGTPVVLWNGKPPTDFNVFGPGPETALDLAATPTGVDDPLVAYTYAGSKRGYGLLTPAKWGPFDTVGEVTVKDLVIEGGEELRDLGTCIEIGPTRNLRLRDLIIRGNAYGIHQYSKVVSYPLWLQDLAMVDNAVVAMNLGQGIVHAHNTNFDRGPRASQIRISLTLGGTFEKFFMAEHPMDAPINIRKFNGQMSFRDGCINYETPGLAPPSYWRVSRDQAGPANVGQLVIDHCEVGTQPPGIAIVDLRDPWVDILGNGRLDVGRGLLTVRDSFTSVVPCTVARPATGAWTVEVETPTSTGTVAVPEDPGGTED